MPKYYTTQTRTTDYPLNEIEPAGLRSGVLYIIHQETALKNERINPWDDHETTRLAVCLQGLINRNFDRHGIAVELRREGNDDFWREYITREGAVYHGMEQVHLHTPEEFFNTFLPMIRRQGLVVWDREVPSTANVASTICGLDGFLPVQNDPVPGGLYDYLVRELQIPVRLDLTGLFEGAVKNKKKIADTGLSSTGSAKCDAYLWALEKYMPRCNPYMMAYTLDGMTALRENKHYNSTCFACNNSGIPNHDYFIYNQAFFFDLTTTSLFPASDDPTQPRCTDYETFTKVLRARYELAHGEWGAIIGFLPWNIKYCHYPEDPPRGEWHMVELCTAYNCGLEADAPGPCSMFNGSLYTNYRRLNPVRGNTPAKNVPYEAGKKYWSIVVSGLDQDCSPWTKAQVPHIWNDPNVGKVPMPFSYCVNLIDRIPMVFDYFFGKQNENCYIMGHEGYTYMIPAMLIRGRVGRECNPSTRVMPDGGEAHLRSALPYFELEKITCCNRVINGFTPLSAPEMRVCARYSPEGVFVEESGMDRKQLMTCSGVPFMMTRHLPGGGYAEQAQALYEMLCDSDYGFVPLWYGNNPTDVVNLTEAFAALLAEKGESDRFVFADPNTFLKIVRESKLGEKAD